MSATDCLQPPLTPEERDIVRSYGGWTNFLICFGLKPWKDDDVDEAKQILRTFVAADEDEDEDEDDDDSDLETAFLSPKEREVVKEYGGWTNFCIAFGLRPWKDPDDVDGALQVLKTLLGDEADGDDDDGDGHDEDDFDDDDSEIEWLNPEQQKVWFEAVESRRYRRGLGIIDSLMSDDDDEEVEASKNGEQKEIKKKGEQKEVKKGEQEKGKQENKTGVQKENNQGEQRLDKTGQKKNKKRGKKKNRKGEKKF